MHVALNVGDSIMELNQELSFFYMINEEAFVYGEESDCIFLRFLNLTFSNL